MVVSFGLIILSVTIYYPAIAFLFAHSIRTKEILFGIHLKWQQLATPFNYLKRLTLHTFCVLFHSCNASSRQKEYDKENHLSGPIRRYIHGQCWQTRKVSQYKRHIVNTVHIHTALIMEIK